MNTDLGLKTIYEETQQLFDIKRASGFSFMIFLENKSYFVF